MSERPWGKGHVVGSDQFFTGRSTSSDSSEALRKAAERSVQQSKEESMTTEHSPEAVAAYPDALIHINPANEGAVLDLRTAFDRGMAERRVVEREALADVIADETGIEAQHVLLELADAILALPSTSLIGAREAVAGAIHDDLAARGISLMPERDALHESKGDQCWAIADALFASGILVPRGESDMPQSETQS